MRDYSWTTDSPVYRIPKERFLFLVNQLEQHLKDWHSDVDAPGGFDRQLAADIVIYMMKQVGTGLTFHCYMLMGQPAGLMVLDETSTPVQLKLLVTHPGSSNCGGVMIEYAVARSVANGQKGCLQLTALDGQAQLAYKALGFEDADRPSTGGFPMDLDPAKSEKWVHINNSWRLKKYSEKKNLVIPPPIPSKDGRIPLAKLRKPAISV